MGLFARLRWQLRSHFWNGIACFKYRFNPLLPVKDIGRARRAAGEIRAVPLNEIFPSIPITNVSVADRVPPNQRADLQVVRDLLTRFLAWLTAVLSPMQANLPPIDADPRRAIAAAYTTRHRRAARRKAAKEGVSPRWALHPPVLPEELSGTADLSGLAVKGPYAGYLQAVENDRFVWDLRGFGQHEHRDGLHRLGARVFFRLGDRPGQRLDAVCIESEDLGAIAPNDPRWPLATRLALCTAHTHTALVRHFTWVHLIGGEYVALAGGAHLPESHPLARLLWPHTFGTQQSNRLGNLGQLAPGGDFETVFSLTHRGVCDLISARADEFRLSRFDPYADAASRGIAEAGIECPSQVNLERLFDVMLRHTRRYLGIYYDGDDAVRNDGAVVAWLQYLNALVPHGLSTTPATLTREGLARLAAQWIYMVSAYHEMVGVGLWNYQFWTDTHPIRVYRDGRREPLDVYQRLVNNAYFLNVIRAPLVDDFSPLALDGPGPAANRANAVDAFRAFKDDLLALQQDMDAQPPAPWTLYPMCLEANINA